MAIGIAEIVALEEELHDPSVRTRPEVVNRLLADAFFEFGRSGGAYGKQDCLEALASEPVEARAVQRIGGDYALRQLAPHLVLLTYKSTVTDPGSGEQKHTHRASIWALLEGRWQMTFHQGTPTGADQVALQQISAIRGYGIPE